MPVLQLANGTVIDESRDIMMWALNQSDPNAWLAVWQRDKDAALRFLDQLDGPFKGILTGTNMPADMTNLRLCCIVTAGRRFG